MEYEKYAKTSSLIMVFVLKNKDINYAITAQNLFKSLKPIESCAFKFLKNLTLKDFVWQPANLPAIRSTSTMPISPDFPCNIDDHCHTNLLYRKTLILCIIACSLFICSIEWSSSFTQRCKYLAFHKHTMQNVNM